jgi:hypothetical protein
MTPTEQAAPETAGWKHLTSLSLLSVVAGPLLRKDRTDFRVDERTTFHRCRTSASSSGESCAGCPV